MQRARNAKKGNTPFSNPSLFAGNNRKGKPIQKSSGPSRPRNPGPRAVSAASAYAQGQRTSEPRISGNYKRTNIKHRELVANLTGTSAFTVANTFALNPGLAATFPWLSTQAQGWEQYRFNRLRFCYYTRTGTSTPGSVLMVPDYDAADPAPISEQVASAYRDVVEEVPWIEEFSCVLDPSSLHAEGPRKYIRTAALAANLDIKTYDAGQLFLCTTDGTAVNWGKVWVEYDVDLFVPQLPAGGTTPFGIAAIGQGSVSKTQIFGSAPTIVGPGSAAVTFGTAANTITFNQAGFFLLTINVQGTVLSGLTASMSTGTLQTGYNGVTAIFNSAATSGLFTVFGQALVGSVLTFTPTATSVSASFTDIANWWGSASVDG
jgi:hypothetical protein